MLRWLVESLQVRIPNVCLRLQSSQISGVEPGFTVLMTVFVPPPSPRLTASATLLLGRSSLLARCRRSLDAVKAGGVELENGSRGLRVLLSPPATTSCYPSQGKLPGGPGLSRRALQKREWQGGGSEGDWQGERDPLRGDCLQSWLGEGRGQTARDADSPQELRAAPTPTAHEEAGLRSCSCKELNSVNDVNEPGVGFSGVLTREPANQHLGCGLGMPTGGGRGAQPDL